MLKLVIIPFFLLPCFLSAQESKKSNENGSEPLCNPELRSLSLEVVIGQNVTLFCQSTNGSLPINYTFFRGNQSLSTMTEKSRKPALFNLTIKSARDLGEYKCKAEIRSPTAPKYSKPLNFKLLDPVSKPVLSTTTSQVRIGQSVTLTCHSENGSFPITYTFFKRNKTLSKVTMNGKAAAVLNVTINSTSDLSSYKCKVENKILNHTKYSNSINFKLAEGNGISYVICVLLALLLLLLAIAIALAIPFLVLPRCKSRRPKSAGFSTDFVSTNKATESENYVTYTEIEYNKSEDVDYANISIIKKEDEDRKAYTKTGTTVVYSEVTARDRTQAKNCVYHHVPATPVLSSCTRDSHPGTTYSAY